MEMTQIRYFLALCEARNFTRAAERCGVTQPALTRAIQRLEEELGGFLFRRDHRRVVPTELGRLMQPKLASILGNAAEARTTARSFLKLEDARLRLGIMCTIGPIRVVELLDRYHRRQPRAQVELHEGTLPELQARLAAGEIDVAILAQPDPYAAELEVMPLYRERFVVGFAKGHRLEAMREVPIRELDGESYLARLNCEFRDRLGEIHEAQGVRARICHRSEREDWVQVMAVAGLGLCLIPEFSPVVAGLQTRPLAEPEVWREVSIVRPAMRRPASAIASFLREVAAIRWPGAAERGSRAAHRP